MSSLYYSGDTGTNRGTSLRRPWDACRRAQIRSDVLRQAAEDLAAEEQAQVERYDPLYRNTSRKKLRVSEQKTVRLTVTMTVGG
jgi:hypothetical protein